jgi:hypothetical protein
LADGKDRSNFVITSTDLNNEEVKSQIESVKVKNGGRYNSDFWEKFEANK